MSMLPLAGKKKKDYESAWVKHFKAQEWKRACYWRELSHMNTPNCSVSWVITFSVKHTVRYLCCYRRRRKMLWATKLLHQIRENVTGAQVKGVFLSVRVPGKALQKKCLKLCLEGWIGHCHSDEVAECFRNNMCKRRQLVQWTFIQGNRGNLSRIS